MINNQYSSNPPVIVLYNLDQCWPPDEKIEIDKLVQHFERELSTEGHPTVSVCLDGETIEPILAGYDPKEYIVFNWCEEIPGVPKSSSMVARQLEDLGFTYTGTNSTALKLSQNKQAIKKRLDKMNIPTPRWKVFTSPDVGSWEQFPAIVKPVFEHCSLGITHEAVVKNQEGLAERVATLLETFQQPILVEDFIEGREFHVTVVGNRKLDVFPIAEMDFSSIPNETDRLCTYDSKFSPASPDYQLIQLRLPADLTAEENETLVNVAIAAYKATDCRDYARLDIRERDGIFYVLDINPNADISPDASVCLSAKEAGLSFGGFGSLLVNLAALRHPVYKKQVIAPQPARELIPVPA